METALPQPSTGPPGSLEPSVAAPGGDAAAQWPPWTGIAAPVAALAASLVLGAVVAAIAAATGASLTGSTPVENLVLTYGGDACFVLVALWFAARVSLPRPEQFGLRRTAISIGMAVALVVASYVLFLVIAKLWTSALNLHENDDKLPKSLGAQDSHAALVAVAVLTCVVAPICEEFLFRGYMFRALRNWRGAWPAALIVGLIFGVFHVSSSPIGFVVPLAAFGVILCFVYQLSGSLYPGIALHAINNAIAFAAIENASTGTAVALLAGALVAVALALRAIVAAWEKIGHVEPAR